MALLSDRIVSHSRAGRAVSQVAQEYQRVCGRSMLCRNRRVCKSRQGLHTEGPLEQCCQCLRIGIKCLPRAFIFSMCWRSNDST